MTVNGGTLDLDGSSPAIGTLSGSGGTVTDGAASGTDTLTVDMSTDATYGGVIEDGSAASVALVNLGSGVLSLSGVNTYTGGTNCDLAQGTRISAAGTVRIAPDSPGSFVSQWLGGDSMDWTDRANWDVPPTPGDATDPGSTLYLSPGGLGAVSNNDFPDGTRFASVEAQGDITVGGDRLALGSISLVSGSDVSFLGMPVTTVGRELDVDVAAGACVSFAYTGSDAWDYHGAIDGAGDLVKTGPGTLYLTGPSTSAVNHWTGNTFVRTGRSSSMGWAAPGSPATSCRRRDRSPWAGPTAMAIRPRAC